MNTAAGPERAAAITDNKKTHLILHTCPPLAPRSPAVTVTPSNVSTLAA